MQRTIVPQVEVIISVTELDLETQINEFLMNKVRDDLTKGDNFKFIDIKFFPASDGSELTAMIIYEETKVFNI
jgi:hypothetical protein